MTDSTEVSIVIQSTPARVFEALSDSQQLQRWFAEYADIDLAAGRYDFWGRHTPGNPERDSGRHAVTNYEPGKGFAFAWTVGGMDSSVQIAVRAEGDGAVATVRHTATAPGADPGALMTDFWCLSLQNLRGWIEHEDVAWRPDYSSFPVHEVRLSLRADASVEDVFAALTEPEQLNRWIAESATVEPVAGGVFDFGWPDEWGRPLKILEIDAPTRLVLDWADGPEARSVVTWELEGSDGATRITLVHNGFDGEGTHEDYYGGWADFLVRLKYMVEAGPSWEGPRVTEASYA